MLLGVGIIRGMHERAWVRNSLRIGALFFVIIAGAVALSYSAQSPAQTAPATAASQQAAPQAPPAATPPSPTTAPSQTIPPAPPRAGLNIVVLDPAHGGTDPGARGTGGMRESEIVLDFAAQVKRALEAQGFQVLQTRQGDEDPSFEDRSALANAQTGAVFVSLHIASTGLPGTVRVYIYSDLPAAADEGSLIPWGRAQAPFEGLSRKMGDLVQGLLAQRFKGSPIGAQTAAVRQLRTTAAPAIAVEVSSVVVEDRAALDQMAPGVADAIATGVAEFRPSYVVPAATGATP
jgi:N-acetylmuramoyl-L-alanine amidase